MQCFSIRTAENVEGPFLEYDGELPEGWDDGLVDGGRGDGPRERWRRSIDFFLEPQYDFVEQSLRQGGVQTLHPNPQSVGAGTSTAEHELLEEWEERRENATVYFMVDDGEREWRFEFEPRDDADPRRLRNPFSMFRAYHAPDGDDPGSDAMLGIRIARHYDHTTIAGKEVDTVPDAMYAADSEDEYDPAWLDDSHWMQEDELLAAASGPDGLDNHLMERFGLPPITRAGLRVATVVDSPKFDHADREIIYVYDWLRTPYFGGISNRTADKFAEREVTDEKMGIDKSWDRKPGEYLVDSRDPHGEYILHCDAEFYRLTSDPKRLAGGEIGHARDSMEQGVNAIAAFGDDPGPHLTNERYDRFVSRQKQLRDELPDLRPVLAARLDPHTDYDMDTFEDRALPV
ncbi:MAG: hypothetical protein SVW02_01155 [Candidatus Nanohaloarchaea archaeon]|nr:hypothetical protein [Candidatus Nanohaloarchaea archaeon]